jgi:DNA-binding SARP family transcriptional activator
MARLYRSRRDRNVQGSVKNARAGRPTVAQVRRTTYPVGVCAMTVCRLRLFGGFEARGSSGEVLRLSTRKAEALTAYLALPTGRSHPREKLAALLWGDRGDAQARGSLRRVLAELKKSLSEATSGGALMLQGHTVALAPAAMEVDVAEFERLIADGAPASLEGAVALYRGDLLAGLSVDEAAFEEWLVAERERLRELAQEALARLLTHQQQAGLPEDAIRTALHLLALDPLQEAVHRTLMRLYVHEGRRGAALRQYQTCLNVVRRELGAEPEPETRALYQELLRRDAAASERPRSSGGTLPGAAAAPAPSPRESAWPRTAWRRDAPAPAPRLIGRDAEQARLAQAVERASRGEGAVTVVLGDAGIGKTALLQWLAAEARRREFGVLLGRAHESTRILPFGPWVDALRTGGVLEEPVLSALDPIWRAELARLAPEAAAPGLPAPSTDASQLFESIVRLVHELARGVPLLIELEDLHWADEMSARQLAILTRRIASSRILIAVSAREEDLVTSVGVRTILDEVERESHVAELRLPPLSREATTALVGALSRAGTDDGAIARWGERVWQISEGNPFVAVETTQALQDAPSSGASDRLPLPERVRSLISARLERVSVTGRQLLNLAAVIGRRFEFPLLARASDLAVQDTAEALEEIVRHRLVHTVEDAFDFTHDRIRDVVLGTLLAPRRTLLHARVASALEEVYASNLEPHHDALALHCREGELWPRALTYLRRAAAQAVARSAYREAVAYLEQALSVVDRLPQDQDTLRQTIDLRFELRNALLPLADHAPIFEDLRAAEVLAARLGDDERLGRIACYLCLSYSATGEHAEAIGAGRRALALSGGGRVPDVEVVAETYLGMAHYAQGDFAESLDFSRRALALLTGDRRRERFGQVNLPAIGAGVHAAWSLAELGGFAEGSGVAEATVQLAEAIDQPYSIAAALRGVGLLYRRQGVLHRAIPALERGVALCEHSRIQIFFPQTASILAAAYVLEGRMAEALPFLDQVLERVTAGSRILGFALVLTELSEALLRAGRLDDASALSGRLLEMSRASTGRGYQAHAARLLGEVAVRRDPPDIDDAVGQYEQAMALGGELGMHPLVTHCHLALGSLHRRLGKRREARHHLTLALKSYRELEMDLWRSPAERELAAVA